MSRPKFPIPELPDCLLEHFDYAINQTARQFHLNELEKEELRSRTQAHLLDRLARKFNPTRGKVSTFGNFVIDNYLRSWKDDTAKQRDDWRAHLEAESKAEVVKRAARACAPSEDIDDTSEDLEDRISFGEELPEETPFDSAVDPAVLARRQRILDVHRTIAAISKRARKICKLYMKLGSTEAVRKKLKLDTRRYYGEWWGPMKVEFAAEWRNRLSAA